MLKQDKKEAKLVICDYQQSIKTPITLSTVKNC